MLDRFREWLIHFSETSPTFRGEKPIGDYFMDSRKCEKATLLAAQFNILTIAFTNGPSTLDDILKNTAKKLLGPKEIFVETDPQGVFDVHGGIAFLSNDDVNTLRFIDLISSEDLTADIDLGPYLFTLYFIYSNIRPEELTYRLWFALDLAALRVTMRYGELLLVFQQTGINHDKTKSINLKKQSEAQEKKAKVFQKYREKKENPLWKNLSLSRRAELIRKDFEKEGFKISKPSISIYLKEGKEIGII